MLSQWRSICTKARLCPCSALLRTLRPTRACIGRTLWRHYEHGLFAVTGRGIYIHVPQYLRCSNLVRCLVKHNQCSQVSHIRQRTHQLLAQLRSGNRTALLVAVRLSWIHSASQGRSVATLHDLLSGGHGQFSSRQSKQNSCRWEVHQRYKSFKFQHTCSFAASRWCSQSCCTRLQAGQLTPA